MLDWSLDQIQIMARGGKPRRGTPLSALTEDDLAALMPTGDTADVR